MCRKGISRPEEAKLFFYPPAPPHLCPPVLLKALPQINLDGEKMDVGPFLRFATLAKCPVSLRALLWNSEGEREGG